MLHDYAESRFCVGFVNCCVIDFRLISEEGFEQDAALPQQKKKQKNRKISSLKRDLDARARSEAYRFVSYSAAFPVLLTF